MPRPDLPSGHASGLRVGYVLKRFPRLSQTFVANEIDTLLRLGTPVEVFSLLPGDNIAGPAGVRVHALCDTRPGDRHADALLRLAPGRPPQQAARLAAWAEDLCVTASSLGLSGLHAHFGSDATTVALLAGQVLGLPVSFTAHARDIYKAYGTPDDDRAMRRAKIAAADRIVTVSDFNRAHLATLAGKEPTGSIVRIYNGVDLARFRPVSPALRERGLILGVGRLVEKKGFADLVSACGLLDRAGTDFRCEIIGDGPLAGPLASQIDRLGLGHRVRLVGARAPDEIAVAMRRASVFALPCVVTPDGDRDGLPTVLIEALASGLPCVSTRLAGIPEIIEDGQSGLLVAPGDTAGLATALGRLLHDADLAASFAQEGRRKAEVHFDINRNVEALQGHFAELARKAGTTPHPLLSTAAE
jgi:colanic acid/amylovoran biosynthesis glycosyltransferase